MGNDIIGNQRMGFADRKVVGLFFTDILDADNFIPDHVRITQVQQVFVFK